MSADAVGTATFGRILEQRAYKEGFSQITKITQLFGSRHNKHTGPVLLFRFTERDLKKEDKDEHRVTRHVERDGAWSFGSP